MHSVIVTITRTTSRNDGMFSTLAVNNFPMAVCLERPWLDKAIAEKQLAASVAAAEQ